EGLPRNTSTLRRAPEDGRNTRKAEMDQGTTGPLTTDYWRRRTEDGGRTTDSGLRIAECGLLAGLHTSFRSVRNRLRFWRIYKCSLKHYAHDPAGTHFRVPEAGAAIPIPLFNEPAITQHHSAASVLHCANRLHLCEPNHCGQGVRRITSIAVWKAN